MPTLVRLSGATHPPATYHSPHRPPTEPHLAASPPWGGPPGPHRTPRSGSGHTFSAFLSLATLALLTVATAATLPAQDFSDLRIELFARGYQFTEGPVWSREGFLLFSDVPANKIHQWNPGEKVGVFREDSNGANGNAYDAKGRLYTCESRTRRVVRYDPKTRKLDVVAESYQGQRLNAPNDIVVRRDGHVYFTDPAFGSQAQNREMDFYGVYHITPKDELELIAKPQGRPNGVALSPDGRILYVANSDERRIYAYDLDRNGKASNERVFIEGIKGPPDGIRTDEKGNLIVTCDTLAVYSPKGELLISLTMPETPRNCTFGDPDFQTLYITAMTSVYRVRMPFHGAIHH